MPRTSKRDDSVPAGLSDPSKDARAAVIYQQAARLIVAKGFDATSMNDIARAAKLTKAGLYYYVPSKQGLLFSIVRYGMETLEQEVMGPCGIIADPEERLREVVRRHARLQTNIGGAITIVTEEVRGLTPAHRRTIVAQKRRYLDFVRETLLALKKKGRLRKGDVSLMSMHIFSTILGVARWYRPRRSQKVDTVSASVVDFVLAAVLKSATNEKSRKK